MSNQVPHLFEREVFAPVFEGRPIVGQTTHEMGDRHEQGIATLLGGEFNAARCLLYDGVKLIELLSATPFGDQAHEEFGNILERGAAHLTPPLIKAVSCERFANGRRSRLIRRSRPPPLRPSLRNPSRAVRSPWSTIVCQGSVIVPRGLGLSTRRSGAWQVE